MEKEYDVALSFAGENRTYVESVASILVSEGIDVFYDNFFETDLWGKDLYQYLNDLYKNKAIYTILFISKEYKEKLWTRHELKSAQARAFSENDEYILPVRFDDTDLPGVNETTGFLDISKMPAKDLAAKIIQKLHNSDFFDKTKLKKTPYSCSIKISNGWEDSTSYFNYHMNNAFPEITNDKIFREKKEIHHRLSILLNDPAPINNKKDNQSGRYDPIWWFRGNSALFITKFRLASNEYCLLDNYELDINHIYVHKSTAYWEDFVYVELNPQKSTDINSYSEDEINQFIKEKGYFNEFVGFYKNKYLKADEVDNGHYVSNGKVHPITGKSEIRIRYLSKYNFFIAPKASPINNSGKIQLYITQFCNDKLKGKVTMEQFLNFYNKLPRIDK